MKRAKDIFLDALDHPPQRRPGFLDEACAGDPSLRTHVEALLRAHEHAHDFLASAATTVGADPPEVVLPPTCEPVGAVIGPYTIERLIGEGGFATVYLARQESPVRRHVALKLLKPGMDSRQVIVRFEQERQTLAMMSHSGIARVFDAGATDSGRPYFVMEHVDGPPITTWCDQRCLAINDRLALFVQVCLAVQHAHQKGVIHRDIKPSNVLVRDVDGIPEVKVIDFGIAKAIEGDAAGARPDVTHARQLVGTPQYMSPEQATLGAASVDTRSDVYSLGILLYELLTGALPFEPKRLRELPVDEIARFMRDEQWPRPSTRIAELGDDSDAVAAARRLDPHHLWRELHGELDWIVLRAIEKDPARRYPTAFALSEDVNRFLRDEPVTARPPSVGYRLSKFVRRHRLELAAAVVVLLALAGLAAGGVWFGLRERASADRLDRELARSRALAEFSQSILTGVDPAQARGADTALLLNILEGASERVDAELAGVPEAAAAMLKTIGFAYLQIGAYAEAEASFRRAIDAAEAPDTDAALESRLNLATALTQQSRFDEAIAVSRPAVEDCRRKYGPADQRTLEAMGSLGTILDNAGRLAEAREVLTEVLTTRRETLGVNHDDTQTSMNNMAVLLSRLDENDDAAALLETILAHQVDSLGEDHPRTLATMNNLAGVYEDIDRRDDAIAMFERVLVIKKRILEPDHPSMLITRGNLASAYIGAGRPAEAESIYREALPVARRVHGDRHMHVVAMLNGLARSLVEQGRPEEAEPYSAEAVSTIRDIAGDDHPNAIVLAGNLAVLQEDLERFETAEATARDAAERAARILGPTHSVTVGARKTQARCLSRLGRGDEARALLESMLQHCETDLGAEHERTAGIRQAMADLGR